jgi:hypothetical protein
MTILNFLNGQKPAPQLEPDKDPAQKMREVVRSEIHDVFDQIMNSPDVLIDEDEETEETEETEGAENGEATEV